MRNTGRKKKLNICVMKPQSTSETSLLISSLLLQNPSHPQVFPGDIVEYPRNKYFSHFAVYYGERDGVPYVAHLTCRGH